MTFTIDDAIRHEKEMAESGYGSAERANEHRQIAFWLEELKIRKSEKCPLVALPEKRGRLIDENEVRIVMSQLIAQPQRPTWNDLYRAIQEMHAVIEAEDE